MTRALSRAGFPFLVQRCQFFIKRLVRVVARFLGRLCFAVLRAIITGLVFTTGAMLMLHFLGVPVPGPSELLDKFEALGELANILS